MFVLGRNRVNIDNMKNQSFVAPLAFWAQAVNAAEIEIAVRAYDRGDYSNALVSFHSLADQGNTRAQHYLGEMYSNGHGVPRQVETALRWYEVAAQSGHREAQVQLGTLYTDGSGRLPPDRAKAHVWLSIAAANGDRKAAVQRDEAEQVMPMDELEKAQALYQEWLIEDGLD